MDRVNATTTTTDIAAMDRALIYAFIVVGLIGLSLNLLLLRTVTKKKELRKAEYMAFVINRALLDVGTCFALFTLQPLGVLYWLQEPVVCTIAASVYGTLGMSVFVSEAILAFNRYISVCKREYYAKIFKKRNVRLICVGIWLTGMAVVAPAIPADALGRAPGSTCTAKHSGENLLLVMATSYSVFFACHIVVFCCYCTIFVNLKRHQQQARVDGQQSRLQEDKALLRYIGAVALAPFLLQIPNSMTTMLGMMMPSEKEVITCLCTVIFTCCPLVNAMLTFTMVRPIRAELAVYLKQIFARKQVTPGPCHHCCQCQAGGTSGSNKGGNSLVVRSHH